MKVLVIQYAGDYRAAYDLAERTGAETYFGHRHILDTLADVAALPAEIAILCCKCPEAYDVILPTGVRAIGVADPVRWNGPEIAAIVKGYAPTHVVVLGPLTRYIRMAIRLRARVLCLFADSFQLHPIRRFVRYGRLAPLLRRAEVEWIGNHGINACLSLARLGVPRDKIVPWDFPHARRPHDVAAKMQAPADAVIMFAGLVIERKGVRDLILAIAALRKRGIAVRAEIAGAGEIARFEQVAREAGVAEHVRFLGLVTNADVVERMRAAAAIAITSQHAYPEGLPLTIYEALSARTPIVASDHPMFARRLMNGETALIYPAGDATALADLIARLLDDPALYAALSTASEGAWEKLQLPVKWGALIRHWIGDGVKDRAWIAAHRLDSGVYDPMMG